MKLEKFIQRNSLNIYKYYIKGYCIKKLEKNTFILFYTEDLAHNIKALFFVDKNGNLELNNVFKLKKYEVPFIKYNDMVIDFDNFYRPVGTIQTQFKLNFSINEEPTTVKSDAFDIIESSDKTNTKLIIHEENRYIKINKNDFFNKLDAISWVPNKIIVHDGKMHSDDIFAAALARYVNPKIKIIRTRNIPEDFDGLIADVGDTRWDHHKDRIYRINKNTGETYIDKYGNIETYAAFGLLAKDILPGIIGEKSYYTIDHQFIAELDNSDNYGTFNPVSYLFESFNPAWNSETSSDENFEEAVKIATSFITQIIDKELAKTEAIPYVKKALKNMKDNILILDKRAPWQGLAKKSSALLTIYPVDTGFAIQTVQENELDSTIKKTKISLPEYWLNENIEGLVFCHQELFFAIFKTKELAIEYAKVAIQLAEEERN